jgi:hypothetical protein
MRIVSVGAHIDPVFLPRNKRPADRALDELQEPFFRIVESVRLLGGIDHPPYPVARILEHAGGLPARPVRLAFTAHFHSGMALGKPSSLDRIRIMEAQMGNERSLLFQALEY